MLGSDSKNESCSGPNPELVEMPFRIAEPIIRRVNAEIQRQFDAKVDERDMPSGQTALLDQFRGD